MNASGIAPPTRESAAGWWPGSAGGAATRPSPDPITGHPPVWPAGRVVAGRYRLRRPLGRGGMGMVWLAVDQALHRPVAVKQALLGGGESRQERQAARRRLRHEARLAAQVDHPGTVRVLDLAEEAGDPWMVMEALPGRTLEATLGVQGPLPVGQVTGIGLRLLETLETIHRAGIVHRDLKPGNVQLCGARRVALTAVVTDPPAPSRRAGPLGPVIAGLLAKDPRRRLGYDQTRSALRAVQGQHPGGRCR